MRRSLVAISIAGALALPPGAHADFYDATADCINRDQRDDYSVVATDPDGKWETLGTAVTAERAQRVADLMNEKRMWPYWAGQFRTAPLGDRGPDGRRLPIQIFVSDAITPFGAAGLLTRYCGPPTAVAIIVSPDPADDFVDNVIWHESFHAFQYGLADEPVIAGSWWAEATATWGEETNTESGRVRDDRDDAFLQHPEIPLDYLPGDTLEPDWHLLAHPYGAWRFVQWLEQNYGERRLWQIMIESFRKTITGTEPTIALQTELERAGGDLGTALGHFWGDHLLPTPGLGPRTRGQRHTADAEADPWRLTRRLAPLTAHVGRVRLPGDVDVGQVVAKADAPEGGGQLWVLAGDGDRLEDWSKGGSATWCIDGYPQARWPGELPAALTAGPGRGAEITLELRVGGAGCRCPRTPPQFDAGDDHSEFWVFGQRFTGVQLDLSVWIQRLARRPLRSRRRTLERGGALMRCAAARARAIRPAPHRKLRRERRRWADATEAAGDSYASGRLRAYQDHAEVAGAAAARIAALVTFLDTEAQAEED